MTGVHFDTLKSLENLSIWHCAEQSPKHRGDIQVLKKIHLAHAILNLSNFKYSELKYLVHIL